VTPRPTRSRLESFTTAGTVETMVTTGQHVRVGGTDADLLRAHGLRVTSGRLSALAALDRHPHTDAERLRQALAAAADLDGVAAPSLQAVHNMLADLHAAGLVRRFQPAHSSARYERRVDDNHHHAVCSGCGRVEDVDCVTGAAPCLHGPTPSGFAVVTAEVTFWGLCADCARPTDQTSDLPGADRVPGPDREDRVPR
jgi:Fur family transcriptional regulator, stress-responsive regulator